MKHATQIRIPATYMRGGTSKGVFFLKDDLPTDQAALDRLMIRVTTRPPGHSPSGL